MRRILLVLSVAAMMLASAMPTFADPGGTGPTGCGVGNGANGNPELGIYGVAYYASHNGGLGIIQDTNPSETIKPYHEYAKTWVCKDSI